MPTPNRIYADATQSHAQHHTERRQMLLESAIFEALEYHLWALANDKTRLPVNVSSILGARQSVEDGLMRELFRRHYD